MADRRTDEINHQRRASDRAAERASRAADHGDPAALRIASSQVESALRRRAEHGRASGSASPDRISRS